MKNLIIGIALLAIGLTACNSIGNNNAENIKKTDTLKLDHTIIKDTTTVNNPGTETDGAMHEMVTQYLQIKNALANDNGSDAASAGNAFVASMGKMETTLFTVAKKKIWDNLADDAKEMAVHIGKNADKIEHQREHFDMLSNDMYDMIKAFGGGQILYQDFCPMYNNKKGATWLSETKEIKNPYLGKKMPACGSVKEVIK